MGNKPATVKQAQAAVKPKLSNAEMIASLRSCRAGNLFIGNMDYVDALLAEYDALRGRVDFYEGNV